ncbi:MAG TPA: hypothetical protein VFS43_30535 [Polyangiaceae bacterium]|nr:hypothetical protein [Polyangiaceae bacterium]
MRATRAKGRGWGVVVAVAGLSAGPGGCGDDRAGAPERAVPASAGRADEGGASARRSAGGDAERLAPEGVSKARGRGPSVEPGAVDRAAGGVSGALREVDDDAEGFDADGRRTDHHGFGGLDASGARGAGRGVAFADVGRSAGRGAEGGALGPARASAAAPVAVAAGGYHSCALTAEGGVQCWGDNYDGQLGDGTTEDRNVPAAVLAAPGVPLTGVRAIALGMFHSCALLEGGQALCWGYNAYGQLGDGSSSSALYPTQVKVSPAEALAGVRSLSAGAYHVCAALGDGRARCWGHNQFGKLGTGSGDSISRYAAEVMASPGEPLVGVRSIALGLHHSCAQLDDESARCWGYNLYGQLGSGTGLNSGLPVTVLASPGAPLAGVKGLAVGAFHTCASFGDGGARCWGSGINGQLGDGLAGAIHSYPRTVLTAPDEPLTGVRALSANFDHTCARLDDGRALCWGLNTYGQLGDGTSRRRPYAAPVERSPGAPLAGVHALAMGDGHGCALTEAGSLLCWGNGARGQLGDGAAPPSYPAPAQAAPGVALSGVRALAFGDQHGCAVTGAGQVLCWGRNHRGQLGDGTDADRSYPVFVEQAPGVRLQGAVALGLGGTQSCAVLSDGSARCWGQAYGDQPGGPNPAYAAPLLAAPGVPLTGVREIALSHSFGCARLEGGQARCWGYNAYGQLGDGSTGTYAEYPAPVLTAPGAPLTGVKGLEVGLVTSCALLESGQARCWGYNYVGELGTGTTDDSPFPMPVLAAPDEPLAGAHSIAYGDGHGCALLEGGQARCWGYNGWGNLGHGPGAGLPHHSVSVLTAPGVPLTGVRSLALGHNHSCAALDDGSARCWGSNFDAELGSGPGPSADYAVPVVVTAPGKPLTGVVALAAAKVSASAALLRTGAVYTWGWNGYGQLGNGTSTYRHRPVAVAWP